MKFLDFLTVACKCTFSDDLNGSKSDASLQCEGLFRYKMFELFRFDINPCKGWSIVYVEQHKQRSHNNDTGKLGTIPKEELAKESKYTGCRKVRCYCEFRLGSNSTNGIEESK